MTFDQRIAAALQAPGMEKISYIGTGFSRTRGKYILRFDGAGGPELEARLLSALSLDASRAEIVFKGEGAPAATEPEAPMGAAADNSADGAENRPDTSEENGSDASAVSLPAIQSVAMKEMNGCCGFSPMMNGCTVELEGSVVTVSLMTDLACAFFEMSGLRKGIEDRLQSELGAKLAVRTAVLPPGAVPSKGGPMKHRRREHTEAPSPGTAPQPSEPDMPPPPPESAAPPEDSDVPWFTDGEQTAAHPAPQAESAADSHGAEAARPRAERGSSEGRSRKKGSGGYELMDIAALETGMSAAICGYVIKGGEVKPTSNPKWSILEYWLSDDTDTICCREFVKPGGKGVEEGQWYRVEGRLEDSRFGRERSVKVSKRTPAEEPLRIDTSAEKRVELHLHTTMSAEDGLTNIGEYVKRAAKWGHKAIAITDHGVVQAFPAASEAGKKHGVKMIYGMEAYMTSDRPVWTGSPDADVHSTYVVFDIETTGLSRVCCEIIEIGAVCIENGRITGRYGEFIEIDKPLPADTVTLTGITDDMLRGSRHEEAVLRDFAEFAGDAVLVAHNAPFDVGFIREKGKRYGLDFANDVLDTVAVSRRLLPEIKNHKLDTLAANFRVPLKHHRAVNDAEATAQILLRFFSMMGERRITALSELNGIPLTPKNRKVYHTIVLAKSQLGLVNLYKLVSEAHINHFYRKPRLPKEVIEAHRDGLIIGSACEAGELFTAILEGESEETVREIAAFYDYLEVQPHSNNEFLIRGGRLGSREELDAIVRRICDLGEELGKPVAATTDAHFLDPKDEVFRRIVMHSIKMKDSDKPSPLYFRTTNEMLAEFAYLGEEKAREIVIEAPNAIAEQIGEIRLFPDETAMPEIPGADEIITEMCETKAREIYGDPLPENIESRMRRELTPIIEHGFSVLYLSAQRLVAKSMSDGYLVGSRGSVGSSFVAFLMGITEVNPLPPHYICPSCAHADFDIDPEEYECGVDMPDKLCPQCGAMYIRDGYNIPFETFLGIDADKVPDIDLNFSGAYQSHAHAYVEEMFGADNVFRAGTISELKDKKAYGCVKHYLDEKGIEVCSAEIDRLTKGVSGVKKTTGQHPGGMVIVPRDRHVCEFTPIQHPANKEDEAITTHFDFNSMHDILIKLDILGHDTPTAIYLLKELTGVDPLTIPLDDADTMEIFLSTKSIGVKPEDIRGVKLGTLGIPEFGTSFTRQMTLDTKPTTMGGLIRIMGLSHGTDVWLGNAQELIKNGTATLKSVICTRDDIMNYLVEKGVEKRRAFFIMESVRKGKWAKGKEKDQAGMEEDMRAVGVDEWFIDSCRKIAYMFPKAHAAAYAIMSLRIAYFKVHHPEAFYATFFTLRCNKDQLEAPIFLKGTAAMLSKLEELEAKGKEASATDKATATMLESAIEMYARGISFLPPDLKRSKPNEFTVEGRSIRMPFVTIPKLGDKVALSLGAAVEEGFASVEELKKKAKLSNSVVSEMKKLGCLTGIPETNQLSFYDLMAR